MLFCGFFPENLTGWEQKVAMDQIGIHFYYVNNIMIIFHSSMFSLPIKKKI